MHQIRALLILALAASAVALPSAAQVPADRQPAILVRALAYDRNVDIAAVWRQALAPTALVNVVAALPDIGVAGLDGSLGVYNLLDDPFVLLQAYQNNHAPLPAEPFEVLLKARYRFAL